jgi:hypothetical protein
MTQPTADTPPRRKVTMARVFHVLVIVAAAFTLMLLAEVRPSTGPTRWASFPRPSGTWSWGTLEEK